MENKLAIWNAVKKPPIQALKPINAGRLKGKTDINPQWRYEVMTSQFGPCGVGWKYQVEKTWSEQGTEGQVFAFAQVNLYIKTETGWSDPIPGVGGSMLVTKEKNGLYSSDEGYKMAITDALSVAMKVLGVGADIYAGRWDGSQYNDAPDTGGKITDEKAALLSLLITQTATDLAKFCKHFGVAKVEDLPEAQYQSALNALQAKKKNREPGAEG